MNEKYKEVDHFYRIWKTQGMESAKNVG